MIIKLQVDQIQNYWEAIKFASTSADGIKKDDVGSYSINLLLNLLNGKDICFISFDQDSRQIQRILIISFIIDFVGNKKGMLFKTLYSFVSGSDDDWASESLKIYEYAKKENCSFISMTTANERVKELALKYGFKPVNVNYKIDL